MRKMYGLSALPGLLKSQCNSALVWLKRKMREPESGCGRCAVCHHVCNLLNESGKKMARIQTQKKEGSAP